MLYNIRRKKIREIMAAQDTCPFPDSAPFFKLSVRNGQVPFRQRGFRLFTEDAITLLDHLCTSYGTDLRDYHPGTAARRIYKRLAATGCPSVIQYASYLQEHPDEYEELVDTLTIKVSSFFRDPMVFEVLGNRVFPDLIERRIKQQTPFVSVWSAGCASGQEVYSAAILLHELTAKIPGFIVRIVGTDVEDRSLAAARQGSYSEQDLAGVKKCYLERYFIKDNNRYKIIPEIIDMVSFGHFNLMEAHTCGPQEGIFCSFDVILCRNVLMYYRRDRQIKTIKKMVNMLNNGGYVVLGKAEFLTQSLNIQLKEIYPGTKIFHKRES